VKESDFVTAAGVIGANDLRIMLRHLLPNSFPPLIVLITLNLGLCGMVCLRINVESGEFII
jgi:ABC-type dipeptide/oligopeptide/nickel transport system permease subunit